MIWKLREYGIQFKLKLEYWHESRTEIVASDEYRNEDSLRQRSIDDLITL